MDLCQVTFRGKYTHAGFSLLQGVKIDKSIPLEPQWPDEGTMSPSGQSK